MAIQAARLRASHPDRDLACQEAVERDLLEIIDKTNMQGWGTVETTDAIEEVVKHLRVAYAEDPGPADEPIIDVRLSLHKRPTDDG